MILAFQSILFTVTSNRHD